MNRSIKPKFIGKSESFFFPAGERKQRTHATRGQAPAAQDKAYEKSPEIRFRRNSHEMTSLSQR
jgi:hypothetical protein